MIGKSVPLDSSEPTALLAQNRTYFDRAACAALNAARLGRSEQAMLWAKLAADCAWAMHPGFYSYPSLEAMLRELGRNLTGTPPVVTPSLPGRKGDKKTWLHLITTASSTGGHTRLVERMIVNTSAVSDDIHSVLLINQEKEPIPSWLGEAVESSGGTMIELPREFSLTDRARAARQIAFDWADRIILHVHPNDPVPSVAFALPGGPPVVFLNHADHVFWLGAGCVDVVADIRLEGHELTVTRRGGAPSKILPIPLISSASSRSATEAKSSLGISDSTVVLLAIAQSYKFAPYGEVDFPANAVKILHRHKDAILLVVGPEETDPHWQNALLHSGDRIRLLGGQKDIEQYFAAADICLESYPIGSLTSTFDAMLRGVPVIRSPRGTPPIFTMSDYDGLGDTASNNEEYLRMVSALITDSSSRKEAGDRQRDAVTDIHTGTGWCDAWQRLLASIPFSHAPLDIKWGHHWENFSDLDLVWSDLQTRQFVVPLDRESFFKKKKRRLHRDSSRGFLFLKLLSSVLHGNLKVARILLRNITH
jgi:hypothetical protein